MALMFKGPAALTGASTVSTSGTIGAGAITGTSLATSSNGNVTVNGSGLVTLGTGGFSLNSKVITSIHDGSAGQTGDGLILATKSYADGLGGIVTPVTIAVGTSDITLANNTTYIVTSAGGVINRALVGSSLTAGAVIRFVVTNAGSAITFTAGTAVGSFKILGAMTATTITFDTAGQGLDFVYAGGELVKLQGGFATAS